MLKSLVQLSSKNLRNSQKFKLSTQNLVSAHSRQFSKRHYGAQSLYYDSQAIVNDVTHGMQLGPDRTQFGSSRQLPDFEVPEFMSLNKKIELSEEQMKQKHPLEYVAEPIRAFEDPYARLNEKSFMITNFPKQVQVSKSYIRDLCLQHDRSAVVNDVNIFYAMTGDDQVTRNQVSYVIVEFEMPKWVTSVRRGLRKQWIQDKLLKVKTLKDKKAESFKERTIVVQGFPSHSTQEEISELLCKFGAITSIEAPSVDSYVQAQLEEKGLLNDHYSKQRQLRKEKEYRYAQIVLAETTQIDKQVADLMKETWGDEKAKEMIKKQKDLQSSFTKVDMLDEERSNAFQRAIVQLQAEGIQVEASKSTLGSLAKELESKVGAESQGIQQNQGQSHDEIMVSRKSEIQGTLKYLLANQENLDNIQKDFLQKFSFDDKSKNEDHMSIGSIDPLHKLQRMSIGELTNAYDYLLGILKNREQLIKDRLGETLKHFGKEEQILFESFDYRKEQETMPDILKKLYRNDMTEIDTILGINEQIQNVNLMKKIAPGEKLYQFLTGSLDYTSEKNWNPNQLAYANTTVYDEHRDMALIPEINMTKTDIKKFGKTPSPFNDDYLNIINERVKKVRDEQDTPFDELYHKERKLVHDIISAQKAIKDVEAKLPNPAQGYLFDPNDIDAHPVYGDMYAHQGEPQYIRDKRVQNQVEMDKKLMSSAELDGSDSLAQASHAYNEIQKQTIDDLIAAGQVNRDEFEAAKAMELANRHVSLGYALVTFSHADEAKQALMLTQGEFYMGPVAAIMLPKANLDHSELDKSYFMKKMQNDSKVVDQKAELREAKERLRDFETNIEKEMPSLKRLKEFKSIAQEMIENPKGRTRRHASSRRTKRETEELYLKLKEYQQQNPNIDVTSLFESEKTDEIRRAMHKRAFQSYKKFEFLKAGITNPREKTTPEQKSVADEVFEPFSYPPLKASVGHMLTEGLQGKINYTGDKITTRGRRFGYTEEEFLEAYLGKDFARKIDLNDNHDNLIFGFQESLKEMVPDKERFLKLPKLLKDQERLEEILGTRRVDGKAADQKFVDYVNSVDIDEMMNAYAQTLDHPHPEDPTRSYLKDLQNMIGDIQTKVKNSSTPNQYARGDVAKVLRKLRDEYSAEALQHDLTGGLLEKWADEQRATVAPFEEEVEAERERSKEERLSGERPDPEQEYIDDFSKGLIEALSPYDDEDFKIADYLEEANGITSDREYRAWEAGHGTDQEREGKAPLEEAQGYDDASLGLDQDGGEEGDIQEDGTEFEEDSMFSPEVNDPSGNDQDSSNAGQGQQSQVNQSVDGVAATLSAEGLVKKWGDTGLYRQSNENLYNLKHANKIGHLESEVKAREVQRLAAAATAFRRAHFNRVKAAQLALPLDQRVPHVLDGKGFARPMTQREIDVASGKISVDDEGNEVEVEFAPPLEEHPLYKKHREYYEGSGSTEAPQAPAPDEEDDEDSDDDEDDQGFFAQRMNDTSEDEREAAEIEAELEDMSQDSRPEPRPILDILNYEAQEVIADMKIDEYLAQYKEYAPIRATLADNDGEMFRYQQTYLDEKDLAEHDFRKDSGGSKSLKDFADTQSGEDVYQQYRDQAEKDKRMSDYEEIKARLAQENEKEERLQKLYDEANGNLPTSPTLEQFFGREAQGHSQINKFDNDEHDKLEQDEEFERIMEAEQDKETYRKELLARMFGGKLSTRQFAVLMNMNENEKEQAKQARLDDFTIEKQAKDQFRVAEELIESTRRSKVLCGEWPEDQSHEIMQSRLDELNSKYPTRSSFERFQKAERKLAENAIALRNSSAIYEREYYFDEGLGESLNDHTEQLKNEFPGLAVQTRRDRDGLPIVKISMAPQFKYDLDDLMNMDPKTMRQMELETKEALTQAFMPEDPKEFLRKVSELDCVGEQDALTTSQQRELKAAMEERYNGKYQEDLDGFSERLMQIKGKKREQGDQIAMQESFDAYDQLLKDQKRFDKDIAMQLKLKMNDKLQFEKGTKSDYVKFSRSENEVFRSQVGSLQESVRLLEKDNEWLLNAGDNFEAASKKKLDEEEFDKEKYTALKQEIKRRKEAKERVLQQGFPEFKSYLRL